MRNSNKHFSSIKHKLVFLFNFYLHVILNFGNCITWVFYESVKNSWIFRCNFQIHNFFIMISFLKMHFQNPKLEMNFYFPGYDRTPSLNIWLDKENFHNIISVTLRFLKFYIYINWDKYIKSAIWFLRLIVLQCPSYDMRP